MRCTDIVISRLRDAAALFHTRGLSKTFLSSVHWTGIKANRLSSHLGEFCKLFCSQTSRQDDFFTADGVRNSEQLFNMIGMCTAFSIGNQPLSIGIQKGSISNEFQCKVHSSPPVLLVVVSSAQNPSIPASEQTPDSHEASPVKLWIKSINGNRSSSLDARIDAGVDVTFESLGFGLPLNIYSNFRYQTTCIQAGSFQLLRPGFRSFFDVVDSNNEEAVKSALEMVRKGAVGKAVPKPGLLSVDPGDSDAIKKDPGVLDFRHIVAHKLLAFDVQRIENLVACARSIFQGLSQICSIIGEDEEYLFTKESCLKSLAEIESIAQRNIRIELFTEDECQVLKRLEQQFHEERERNLRLKKRLTRKFDSYAPCYMKDIEDQLVPGALNFLDDFVY
jgi:hypothetical protein